MPQSKDARHWLPHKGRAVYVDKVLSISENGGEVSCIFPKDCDVVLQDGTVDECVLIEAMAQAAGAIFLYDSHQRGTQENTNGALVGITDFEVSEQIHCDKECVISIERGERFDNLFLANASIATEGRTVATATLKIYQGEI